MPAARARVFTIVATDRSVRRCSVVWSPLRTRWKIGPAWMPAPVQPCLECLHAAQGAVIAPDCQGAAGQVAGLGIPDGDEHAPGHELNVANVERDQVGTPQRRGHADEQDRAVAPAGVRSCGIAATMRSRSSSLIASLAWDALGGLRTRAPKRPCTRAHRRRGPTPTPDKLPGKLEHANLATALQSDPNGRLPGVVRRPDLQRRGT